MVNEKFRTPSKIKPYNYIIFLYKSESHLLNYCMMYMYSLHIFIQTYSLSTV